MSDYTPKERLIKMGEKFKNIFKANSSDTSVNYEELFYIEQKLRMKAREDLNFIRKELKEINEEIRRRDEY